MSTLTRTINLAVVFGPFVGLAVAIPLLWGDLIGVSDLVVFAIMYLVAGLGVTAGYHRLLTHRSFTTYKPIEYGFAVMGSLALQGSPIEWVADHRKHHAHADEDGDPHSPHTSHGGGVGGAIKGLWHAHVGWLFETQGQAGARRYAKELVEDRRMLAISRAFPYLALLTLALPALLGFLLTGTAHGALTGFIWGGLVRIVLLHHITWSVNSVCHFFGERRFEVKDQSTNVFWLSLPSLGESWHHNHHAFARSAFHGLSRWEAILDPTGWVIRGMRRVGLAWNVVAITPERQQRKLAPPSTG